MGFGQSDTLICPPSGRTSPLTSAEKSLPRGDLQLSKTFLVGYSSPASLSKTAHFFLLGQMFFSKLQLWLQFLKSCMPIETSIGYPLINFSIHFSVIHIVSQQTLLGSTKSLVVEWKPHEGWALTVCLQLCLQGLTLQQSLNKYLVNLIQCLLWRRLLVDDASTHSPSSFATRALSLSWAHFAARYGHVVLCSAV